jgi:hypothetical protein
MRLRGPISTALVFTVLTMSTWAPACDLFCSLTLLHFFDCPAHGAHSSAGDESPLVAGAAPISDMAMDHMAMAGDNHPMESATESLTVMLPATTSCGHEPCSQTTISVNPKRTVEHSPLAIAAALESPVSDSVFSQIRATKLDETPPKLGPPDPLNTPLRI